MTIPEDIASWRRMQRADLLARRMAASQADRSRWNEAITELIVASFPLLQGMTVGFYWPFKAEFDPRFAIRRLRDGGARAALPVVVQKRAPLEFREWWPGVRTAPGVFDLPVPQDTPVLQPDALLMPPVGFDANAYRLGYGGGYFDRTLAARTPQPLKIGVAFELSRIPTIRPQAHDIPLDFIVTETGVHCVGAHGLATLADPSQVNARATAVVLARAREEG